jgi:hypothetical protein
MALRLAEYVVSGEIINTRKNSVHGYLSLRGCDRAIVLQLTGNCDADLAGKHIRFEAKSSPLVEAGEITEREMDDRHLAWMQIGVPGEMSANRQVRGFDCSIDEFLTRSKLGEQPPTEWKRCLYLEWFGQNGRIVVELVDPVIEFVDDTDTAIADVDTDDLDLDDLDADDLEDDDDDLPWDDDLDDLELEEDEDAAGLGGNGLGSTFELNEGDDSEPWNAPQYDLDDEDEDPYGLFPRDLGATLDAAVPNQPWESGPDEETLPQWKEWDEVFDGTKDVPLSTLFDPPLKLPPVDSLDDPQVEAQLKAILMQLALHNIAFHMCEHFTPRAAYKLLVEEILREQGAHPDLPRIGYTMNFDTSESCDECAAEFERRDAERRKNRPGSGDVPDDEMPF